MSSACTRLTSSTAEHRWVRAVMAWVLVLAECHARVSNMMCGAHQAAGKQLDAPVVDHIPACRASWRCSAATLARSAAKCANRLMQRCVHCAVLCWLGLLGCACSKQRQVMCCFHVMHCKVGSCCTASVLALCEDSERTISCDPLLHLRRMQHALLVCRAMLCCDASRVMLCPVGC